MISELGQLTITNKFGSHWVINTLDIVQKWEDGFKYFGNYIVFIRS